MDFKEYSPLALRTAKVFPDMNENLWHGVAGMVTESGEIVDAYKRHRVYGKPLDVTNLLEELGDICWYVNLFAHFHKIDLAGVKPWDDAFICLSEDMVCVCGLQAASSFLYLSVELKEIDNEQAAVAESVRVIVDCVTRLAVFLGSDLSTVLSMNITKLAKRYGDKYSDYLALNRDLDAERQVLESGSAG